MGGSSSKVTVGYKYYLGMHLILCHGPVDKITKIRVDDRVAWTGAATGGPISVSATSLFGGEKREGGVSGTVDIEMGGPTQARNSYLQSKLGADIPAFRGVVGAVLRQCYLGLNPYLKRWSWWVSRIHVRQNGLAQWYDAKAEISGDMNPAHIVRECLTDPTWGMGYPEADMDDTAFTAAADQLYSEGMGMSLLWDRSVTLEEFIQIILKHIDASLYVDRTTGKFVLKLVRGGYDVNSLLVLDEDSIDKITDFKRGSVGELVNSVTVVYWDATTGKNGSVTVQDIALIAQQQTIIGTTKQFPGFTNGSIATRVASRSLKALSIPMASGIIYATRKAASLNVGDVFVLNWARYGVSNLVMRVTSVELGALGNDMIKIQAVEDVFALSSAVYAAPPPSGWTNPNSAPAAVPYHNVIEAPFWEMVQRLGETSARSLPTTAGFVLATGVRPSGDASNAVLMTNPTNTTWEEAGTVDFTPTALLSAAITPTATSLPIDTTIDLDAVATGSYLMVDSELMRVDAITDTAITVGRGVLDTVAASHSQGARVFFSDAFFETDGVEYATGETARIRLLPTTGQGTLALTAAPIQTLTIAARQAKPYPPGKFRLNNAAYPTTLAYNADLVVSWAHRDRLQQTATLVEESFGDIGPEAGVTYTCQVLTQSGTLISSKTGLTGTSVTFATNVPFTPSAHVYWRVRFSASSGTSTDIWLDEVSFRDASNNDLSVGGTASASGSFSASYLPALAFDKSTATNGWASNSVACWIAYQHTSSVAVSKVVLTCPGEASASDELPVDGAVFLEYSDNGTTWVPAGSLVRESGAWAVGNVVTLTPTSTPGDLGANYGPLRARLWSVRGDVASLQMHDWVFTRNFPPPAAPTGLTATAEAF